MRAASYLFVGQIVVCLLYIAIDKERGRREEGRRRKERGGGGLRKAPKAKIAMNYILAILIDAQTEALLGPI